MKKYKSLIILLFLSMYICIPVIIFFLLEDKILTSFLYSLLIFFILILFSELIFKLINRFSMSKKFVFDKNFSKDKIYFKSHPYLPYEMNKNMPFIQKTKANYIESKFNYYYPSLSSNNFGFANGEDGSREVKISKKNGLFRINCLGGSTTGNYLEYGGKIYSYPLLLEELIKERNYYQKTEVNNFGQGGYNSSEVLINFLFKVIHTNPDMIILYIGYNDIRSYLTKNFVHDYSHSRKNLNLSDINIIIYDLLPKINVNFYKFLVQKIGIRNSLIDAVSCGEIDINQNPNEGLYVFRSNIEHIITLCKEKNIILILSSFCKNENKVEKNNSLGRKFLEIVDIENKIIRDLSIKHNCEFIDNERMIEKNDDNFVDSIHFSHLGMTKLAENFFDRIKKYL